MTRYNLVQARGADFTVGTEGIAAEGEGNDVVSLAIKRGSIQVIVPAELPDNKVFGDKWSNCHTCLEIELEDGTRLSGWLRSGEGFLEAN